MTRNDYIRAWLAQGLNLDQIGARLGLTGARIAQISKGFRPAKTHFRRCGHKIEGNSIKNGKYLRCLTCHNESSLRWHHNNQVSEGKKKERPSPYVNQPCLLSDVWK